MPQSSPLRDYALTVAITLTAVIVPLSPGCLNRAGLEPRSAPPASEEAPPAIWATDGAAEDAGPIARPMPGKPFEGQKKPPCNKKLGQVALNGGCWLALEVRPSEVPGCGADYFEHGGKCYLPVQQATRPPTSVQP